MTHSRRARVLVVADDLTGANDTGVQFAEAGWATVLQLAPSDQAAGTVVAVSTDQRAASHEAATRVTERAISDQNLGVDDHLYLKIDSTMRGSVAAQVDGALRGARAVRGDALVVLCPAYPAMGRTIEDGRLLVNGRSVTESPAGVDPATPVLLDVVAELVPGAVAVGRRDAAADWARAIDEASGASGIVAVDATTDDDLVLLAEAVDLLGARAIPAGSAGLAGPLAERWGTDEAARPVLREKAVRRPLVLVTSHHAVARDQVAALAELPDVTVVVRGLAAVLAGPDPAVPTTGPVVLASPDDRADPGLAARIASALADQAAAWTSAADVPFDAVVLVGGDGAEAFLRRVGATGVAVRGRLLEGVPDGHIVGGAHDGLTVVTKAGGFGDRTTLTTVLHSLLTLTDSETSR